MLHHFATRTFDVQHMSPIISPTKTGPLIPIECNPSFITHNNIYNSSKPNSSPLKKRLVGRLDPASLLAAPPYFQWLLLLVSGRVKVEILLES